MKPDSLFEFQRTPEARTRYKLVSHAGKPVPDFPAVWKVGPRKGERYIIFRRYEDHRPHHGGERFDFCLSLDKNKVVTGFSFPPGEPCRSFGDFGNYAILIDFDQNFEHLKIRFFEGMKAQAESLFQAEKPRQKIVVAIEGGSNGR